MRHPIPSGVSFGLLPRLSKYGDGEFACYTSYAELAPLDRKLWVPTSLNRHVSHIYSQLDGMCTSNAAVTCMMVERSFRGRPKTPVLSAEYLYYLHSTWGTGSTLGENLRELIFHGTITRDQAGPDGKSPPDDHEVLSERNRILEPVDLDANFDVVATAIQRYKPCLIGVRWPGGGGGHAVCATQLARTRRDGWVLRGPNSWGRWGDPPLYTREEKSWLEVRGYPLLDYGWWTLTERECADFSTYGCWAVGTST